MKRRGSNEDITTLFQLMARDEARHAGFINDALREAGIRVNLGFLDPAKEVHLLPSKVHLLRDISVREDWLCALYHDLSPSGKEPRIALPPNLSSGSESGAMTNLPWRSFRFALKTDPKLTETWANKSCGSSSSLPPFIPPCGCATTSAPCSTKRLAWT